MVGAATLLRRRRVLVAARPRRGGALFAGELEARPRPRRRQRRRLPPGHRSHPRRPTATLRRRRSATGSSPTPRPRSSSAPPPTSSQRRVARSGCRLPKQRCCRDSQRRWHCGRCAAGRPSSATSAAPTRRPSPTPTRGWPDDNARGDDFVPAASRRERRARGVALVGFAFVDRFGGSRPRVSRSGSMATASRSRLAVGLVGRALLVAITIEARRASTLDRSASRRCDAYLADLRRVSSPSASSRQCRHPCYLRPQAPTQRRVRLASRARRGGEHRGRAANRRRSPVRRSPERTDDKSQVGYPLGVSRRPHGVELVASWETSLELVAPPGAGKTLRVLARILRQHPGPCLATATKPDLYEVSAAARERLGPVFALDPDRLCPAAEPLCWSPVARLRGLGGRRAAGRGARRGGGRGGRPPFGELLPPFGDHRSRRLPPRRGPRRARRSPTSSPGPARPSDPAPLRILSEHLDGRGRLGGAAPPAHLWRRGDDVGRDALGRPGALRPSSTTRCSRVVRSMPNTPSTSPRALSCSDDDLRARKGPRLGLGRQRSAHHRLLRRAPHRGRTRGGAASRPPARPAAPRAAWTRRLRSFPCRGCRPSSPTAAAAASRRCSRCSRSPRRPSVGDNRRGDDPQRRHR